MFFPDICGHASLPGFDLCFTEYVGEGGQEVSGEVQVK